MKTSQKICAGLLTAATVFSMFSPILVQAKSTVKATSSGSTSGNESNTIKTSKCTGSNQLSGLDAQIFSKITPDHAGTVVCAKSDGFKTVATGISNVNSYHWTAWYKNSLTEDVDRTQGTGNYHGFPKSKVEEWKKYAENIKKLNGGKFPESRNYVYPTDTKNGKLSFWGDIAGYYGVLGDPQYAKIHLEAYQQFSYRVEKTDVSYRLSYDSNYCNDYPEECAPVEEEKPSKPSGGNKPNKPSKPSGGNGGSSSGGGSYCDKYPEKCDKPTSNGPGYCSNGVPTWGCMTYCPGSSCTSNNHPGNLGDKYFPSSGNGSNAGASKPSNNPCVGTSCYWDAKSSSKIAYLGGGWYRTTTTTVNTYNETKQVKVADATVAAKAYATEIAAYSRIALKPGSRGTLTYNVNHNKFWKTTPSYWVDGGKETIKNKSYPYHFGSESQEGKGKNNINLYALITKKDKLYTVIHGYPDITVVDVPDDNGYPGGQPETCVEVKGKNTCSKKETPLIDVEIDITKDEPQSQVEVDRFVHLTKDKK